MSEEIRENCIPTPEDIEKAERLKSEANEYFKSELSPNTLHKKKHTHEH